MLSKQNFNLAVKTSSPIFFGYVSIGIPFGLIVVNSGYPWWIAPLMSLVMFSGTAQYIGIALFASGITKGDPYWKTLLNILGIELVIGLRHVFYSLSFLEKYKGTGKWKIPLIYTISDETYAVISNCKVPEDADKGTFFATISLLDFSYWFFGTVVGALLGNFIPSGYLNGVDFALTALFIVIMINQIRETKDFLPSLTGILTALFAVFLSYKKIGSKALLPSQHVILVGLSLGIAAIILIRGISSKKKKDSSAENKKDKEVSE